MKAEVDINVVCDVCGEEIDYWYGDWSETLHVKACEQCKKDVWISAEDKQPIEDGYYLVITKDYYAEVALALYTNGNWDVIQGYLGTFSNNDLKWKNICD